MSGPTASAWLVGKVQGVVVQASASTPASSATTFFIGSERVVRGESESYRDGLILAILIDVVIHAQLMVR